MAEAASMKAPDAFRTISEVAEELELPQHVLRFWETRFNQIKPMKRGGGRRYYRPEDVDLLRGIRLLLYGEGFTIRGVQRLLKDKGVAFVVSVGKTGSVQTVTAAEPTRRTTARHRARSLVRRSRLSGWRPTTAPSMINLCRRSSPGVVAPPPAVQCRRRHHLALS